MLFMKSILPTLRRVNVDAAPAGESTAPMTLSDPFQVPGNPPFSHGLDDGIA